MNAIQGYFSNERERFYSDIWQEYMLTAVCFVTQASLQSSEEWLRDEADPRVQLRKAAARDLRSMWFRLTPVQKMAYIPRLVGAFLKVALVEDDETREATIPIFFDMMQCEFHSCVEDRKNFKKVTHFSNFLFLRSDKELWEGGGRELIERVDRLLGHLFEYRLVRETSDCMENGMSKTVQLLRYYEKYRHHDLYITYVYKLYDLHILYNNQIEAAKTLLLYANTLSWDDIELDESLISRRLNRQCAVERQLKDSLLCEAADLFAEGEMWEDAIKILKELLPVYEKTYVNYDKLASLMIRIAELYRKIDRENRAFFYYYLVAFYGKGFPSCLNGISFVFRSDKLERHADFMQRMQQVFFSDECAKIYDSEEKQLAMQLSALIIEQVLMHFHNFLKIEDVVIVKVEILEFCLYAHASRSEITKQFHDHLVEGFYEHKQYVEDKFGRTRSILPPGASIRYSVESNGIDASKKNVSSQSLDAGLSGTLNLRSRGAAIGSTMLSMLTTSRKSSTHANASSSAATLANNRTPSERFDAARVFATMRNSSMDSLKSPARTNRRPTIEGIEGIRLRSRVRRSTDQSAGAPPLPPRTHKSSDLVDNFGEHRHNKSPVPTPITDLADLQRY
ncbi:hypothetical protein OESDEN_03372 [Oesophagostomum dentatum]|uniref:DOCKER domain-containing protein n=1 Tax=Oesophagostomum dentatum TaxID=61180 RepID=A0A0B1TMS1_OESDE|nr:hypothetical protein OESDEN_03372 [Oesophagostomum dentatum]